MFSSVRLNKADNLRTTYNLCCRGMYVCVHVRMLVCGFTGTKVCFRAYSLTYSACNAHAPYCLRLLWLRHIFRRYLIYLRYERANSLFSQFCEHAGKETYEKSYVKFYKDVNMFLFVKKKIIALSNANLLIVLSPKFKHINFI